MVPLRGGGVEIVSSVIGGGMVASAANARVSLESLGTVDGPRWSYRHPRRRGKAWEIPRW
jgi:hypothetical protein